jgi:hypothetical protein
MKNLIFFIVFYCQIIIANGQTNITKKIFLIDSLNIVKTKLIRPQFRFDNRLTFLNGQKLSITGFDGGVLLSEKLRIALGYYKVSDKFTSLTKRVNDVEYQGQYKLNYGALNIEFIYKNKRFFSLGMPLEIGLGNNTLNYRSKIDGTETEGRSGFIAMAYFGLSGTFKPIRWMGLKGAIGYRKTLFNQIRDLAFDGIYTSVGLTVDFWEIIKDHRMYKLKRRYHKNSNPIETAVDLITN